MRPLLFRVSQTDQGTSYELGWVPALAAIAAFGNFYLNLAAKMHWWPCVGGCS